MFVYIIWVVYIIIQCVMTNETFDRGFESNNSKSLEVWQSFDEEGYSKGIEESQKKMAQSKEEDLHEADDLISKLNEKDVNHEKVQEFIRNNCSEPIEWVDTIVPYKELFDSLVKSAEDEFEKVKSLWVWVESKEYKDAFEVKNKLELFKKSKKEKLSDEEKKRIEGLAKDKRLYELPVYKKLIEKWWFILPSDVRDYYDSAGQVSVYHLWIDYNVKAGTEVKSMYKWKVVKSGLDWWLWHKVIIEHETGDWTKFYSLYGHLGSKNLPTVWQTVEKGMKIWEIWIYEENWWWNSHLHFQIMKNVDSDRWYYKLKDTEIQEEEKRTKGKIKEEEKINLVMRKTRNYNVLESFGK